MKSLETLTRMVQSLIDRDTIPEGDPKRTFVLRTDGLRPKGRPKIPTSPELMVLATEFVGLANSRADERHLKMFLKTQLQALGVKRLSEIKDGNKRVILRTELEAYAASWVADGK